MLVCLAVNILAPSLESFISIFYRLIGPGVLVRTNKCMVMTTSEALHCSEEKKEDLDFNNFVASPM
jgi:hypothetical protein